MKAWCKYWLSFYFARVFVFLQAVPNFFFSQGVLYCFIGKIFFRRREPVPCEKGVLSISESLLDNACLWVLSISYRIKIRLRRWCFLVNFSITKNSQRSSKFEDAENMTERFQIYSLKYPNRTFLVRISQNAKFCAKLKILRFGPKMSDLSFFRLQF